MMNGNIPMLKKYPTAAWNPQRTRYAGKRVRRNDSHRTIVVSKTNPPQLMAYASQRSSSHGPTSGVSVRADIHTLRGWAWRSQSGCALARPANT